MFAWIVLILICLVAVLAAIVAMQPGRFRIARSIAIHAAPSVIFEQVHDFHHWAAWSPWEKLDPVMSKTFEGPTSGVGAIYSWTGNKKVGKGTMTLLESRPTDFIRIRVQFFIPFKATNTSEFTFISDGAETVVTWAMLGDKNFLFKAMYMIMPMDRMIGSDFEKGLAQLKQNVESAVASG